MLQDDGAAIKVAKIGLVGVIAAALIALIPFFVTRCEGDGPTPSTVATGGPFTLPTIPVPSVFLSKESGPGGAKLTVAGEGFEPGEKVDLRMQTILLATTTADSNGRFSGVTITVPKELSAFAPQQFEVDATGRTSIRTGSAPFTVSG
jgi:hypothetical protein